MSTATATEHARGDGRARPKWLLHHFDTPAQQFGTARLGMWLFLAQEVLFFGALLILYGVFRSFYPDMFKAASQQLDKIMGATNTVVLIFSSLTAALAVNAAQKGKRHATSLYLLVTIACACVFLAIKYIEYKHKIDAGLLPGPAFKPHDELLAKGLDLKPNSGTFFALYFVMTGLHALHVVVGIVVFVWILIRNIMGNFSREYFTAVDIAALYWHFVDLVWIFLFPLLYLV
jgi:cytochrome c oxidase subunit 3